MINLDQKYHDYLTSPKTLRIDGVNERVRGYGYHFDGSDIVGYYLTTDNYKLYYNTISYTHLTLPTTTIV